jgi:hypothetical protein
MRTGLPVHPPWSTGFAPAVGVLTRLLQPVKAHLYSQGIKLSRYVNDRRIAAALEKETVEQLGQAPEVIQNSG